MNKGWLLAKTTTNCNLHSLARYFQVTFLDVLLKYNAIIGIPSKKLLSIISKFSSEYNWMHHLAETCLDQGQDHWLDHRSSQDCITDWKKKLEKSKNQIV